MKIFNSHTPTSALRTGRRRRTSLNIMIEASVAKAKEPCAKHEPDLHQWMLGECPQGKLRAGMKKAMGLMRDFDVADETPASSVTDDELRGALGTTPVNRWGGEGLR